MLRSVDSYFVNQAVRTN